MTDPNNRMPAYERGRMEQIHRDLGNPAKVTYQEIYEIVISDKYTTQAQIDRALKKLVKSKQEG